MNVCDIMRAFCDANGYDGYCLDHEPCACLKEDDLAPCGTPDVRCEPGWLCHIWCDGEPVFSISEEMQQIDSDGWRIVQDGTHFHEDEDEGEICDFCYGTRESCLCPKPNNPRLRYSGQDREWRALPQNIAPEDAGHPLAIWKKFEVENDQAESKQFYTQVSGQAAIQCKYIQAVIPCKYTREAAIRLCGPGGPNGPTSRWGRLERLFEARVQKGIATYGKTLEEAVALKQPDCLEIAQTYLPEEVADAAVYCAAIMDDARIGHKEEVWEALSRLIEFAETAAQTLEGAE